MNLSGISLSPIEIDVLASGIRFVPFAPSPPNLLHKGLERLARSLRVSVCALTFDKRKIRDQSLIALPSSFNPLKYTPYIRQRMDIAREVEEAEALISSFSKQLKQAFSQPRFPLTPNLSQAERHCLERLQSKYPNLVFVPADKDRSLVILTLERYVELSKAHLEDQLVYKYLGSLAPPSRPSWLVDLMREQEELERENPLNSISLTALQSALQSFPFACSLSSLNREGKKRQKSKLKKDDSLPWSQLSALYEQMMQLAEEMKAYANSLEWEALPFTQKERDFLASHMLHMDLKTAALPQFRILIKTHKKVLAGRPIAGAWKWITTPLSQFLSKVLRSLLQKTHPTMIVDTRDFISSLESLHRQHLLSPGSYLLATADIKAMYPSIDIEFGLRAMRRFLLTFTNWSDLTLRLLCFLARKILTTMAVKFGNDVFLQVRGTAMGTNFAPEYAYMVYWEIERQVFPGWCQGIWTTASHQIPVCWYGRYIDDLFFVIKRKETRSQFWEENPKDLEVEKESLRHAILSEFNSRNDLLQLDIPSVDFSVPFLDAQVTLSWTWGLDISPYYKPTATFLFLPPFSMHHPTTMLGWTANETRRLLLLSSRNLTYLKHVHLFFQHLAERGYPPHFLRRIRKRMWPHRDRFLLLQSKVIDPQRKNLTPLIFPYGKQLGRVSPKKIMTLASWQTGVSSHHFTKMRFLNAWSRQRNLAEILRVPHQSIAEHAKRKRDQNSQVCSSSKRRKKD